MTVFINETGEMGEGARPGTILTMMLCLMPGEPLLPFPCITSCACHPERSEGSWTPIPIYSSKLLCSRQCSEGSWTPTPCKVT